MNEPPRNINGYDPTRDADGFRWDGDAAQLAVDFFPTFLTHTKGHTGPLRLEPWQTDIIATLFGWLRPDGTRRYRETLIAVPRKNGKTTLAAGVALYLLTADGQTGAEVYSAAGSRDQATLVYEQAAAMVRACPALDSRLKVRDATKRIAYVGKGSYYRAVAADAGTLHGTNPHGVIFDELHTQPNRDLYDVFKSGMGARQNPLFVAITTAGYDRHSICHEVWSYARSVRDGLINDPHFLPAIWELPDGADWQDPDVWHKCNPNLGVSIGLEFLREECERAKQLPSYENTFRNLYLNQWTEQAVRWLPMDTWRRGGELEAPNLDGQECWAGLDLSSNLDVTALSLVFKRDDGGYWVLPYFWIPGGEVLKRVKRDRVPYDVWTRDGWITMQPTASIDHDLLLADLEKISQRYWIRQIAVDRWNAEHVISKLSAAGLEVVKFGQGFASMSGPSKQFEKLVLDGKIGHQNNPVLNWMAGNVSVLRDAAENMKPDKATSSDRIDGIVATIMAVGLAGLVAEPTSFYTSNSLEMA